MKKIYSTASKQQEIETVHSSLYSFTKKKLSNLESYGAYHFLINKFESKFHDSILNGEEAHCNNNGCNEDSFDG